MNRILIIIIISFVTILSYGQSIVGAINVKGGEYFPYSYVSPIPGQAQYGGDICKISVTNGKAKYSTFVLPTGGTAYLVPVTWDNITGKGTIVVNNTANKTTAVLNVNITKQNTIITISENITSNRNISGYIVAISNTDVSNNSTVVFTAEKEIRISPNTYFRGGTNVLLSIMNSLSYGIREMSMQEEDGGTLPEYDLDVLNGEVISQNYPNPFNGQTKIICNIPELKGDSYIQIIDVMGKQVRRIPIDQSGRHEIVIDRSDMVSGIYTYSLILNNQLVDTKRMIVNN